MSFLSSSGRKFDGFRSVEKQIELPRPCNRQTLSGSGRKFDHFRALENRDVMSFLSQYDQKSDEFRVFEHNFTSREEKFEGIETSEDSVLNIPRGVDLDRTSELWSKLFSSPRRIPRSIEIARRF